MEAQSERTKDTPLSLACSGGRYEVRKNYFNVILSFVKLIQLDLGL